MSCSFLVDKISRVEASNDVEKTTSENDVYFYTIQWVYRHEIDYDTLKTTLIARP